MSDPITREETYLAALSGEAVSLPDPITRNEMYLAYLCGIDVNLPAPITRKNYFMYTLCQQGVGGGGVTIRNQDKTITENGEYTADAGYTGLGTVTVNVEAVSGGEDAMNAFLTGTLERYSNSKISTIPAYAFYKSDYGSALKEVSFPNVTTIGGYAFYGQSTLAIDNDTFPKVETIESLALGGCVAESVTFEKIETLKVSAFHNFKAKEIRLPNLTGTGVRLFKGCSVLESVYLPKLAYVGNELVQGCTALTHLCLPAATLIAKNAFWDNALALKALILPGSTIVTVGTSLTLPTAETYIYVPSNLLSEYKQATNWAAIADNIVAIEENAEILQWLTDNGYEYEVTT